MLLAGMEHNWIGEPSAVLVSRAAFEQCGLFNRYIRQTIDLELWLRVMLRCRIGFLDKPVCLYRMHQASISAANQGQNRDWLDRVWLFESLLYENDLGPFRTSVFHLRRKAIRQAVRMQARRLQRASSRRSWPTTSGSERFPRRRVERSYATGSAASPSRRPVSGSGSRG